MEEPARLERIERNTLAFVVRFSLAISPVAMAFFLYGYLQTGDPLILVEAIVFASYAITLWAPGFSHSARAGLFTAAVTLVSVLALVNYGPTIGTGTFFFGSCLCGAFFFGGRGGAAVGAVLAVAYVSTALGSVNGWMSVPNPPEDLEVWVRMGLSSVMPLVAVTYLGLRIREELRAAIRAEDLAHAREQAAHEELAFAVSHDLMEPVRTIEGFVELVLDSRDSVLAEEDRAHLGVARDAASRMRELIIALVRYARVASRGPLEVVDSTAVATEAVSDLGELVRENGATVTVEELPACLADRPRLRQVFTNLIGNAVKYGRPGIPVEVHVSGEQVGQTVRFRVDDNGVGIPEAQWQKVLEVFQRSSLTRDRQGTGMGLAIVRRIVERHEGSLFIDTPPSGEGTRVVFELRAP
jgi:signal transduction histidine kinase